MKPGLLEHMNLTVRDPDMTAAMLVKLFGWHIRWAGVAKFGGRTVHVGTDTHYLALYTLPGAKPVEPDSSYSSIGAVNHIGVLVDDLGEAETRVLGAGYKTHSHQTYEPGSRFYFHDTDGIEYEVVSYA